MCWLLSIHLKARRPRYKGKVPKIASFFLIFDLICANCNGDTANSISK